MHRSRRDNDAVARVKGAPLVLELLLDDAGDDIPYLFLIPGQRLQHSITH
jgi:hypothetical protein